MSRSSDLAAIADLIQQPKAVSWYAHRTDQQISDLLDSLRAERDRPNTIEAVWLDADITVT